MVFSRVIAFLLLLFVFPLALAAQFVERSASLGPTVSYLFSAPTTFDRKEGKINTFGTDGTGNSSDHAISLGLLWNSPALDNSLALSLLGEFAVGTNTFTSVAFSSNDTVYVNNQPVLGSNQQFLLNGTYSLVKGSATIDFPLSNNLTIGSGFWVSYRLTNALLQTREILSPTAALFKGDRRIDTVTQGDAIATSKLHFGIPVSIAKKISIAKHTDLQVELYGQMDLGEALRGFAGQSFGLGLRTALLFDLFSKPLLVPIIDTVSKVSHAEVKPELEFPPGLESQPELHFMVSGKEARSVEIQAIDTFRRRTVSLPLRICFEPNSSVLSQYQLGNTSDFTENVFERKSYDEIHKAMLAVIGNRLSANPASKLVIKGYYANRNTTALIKEQQTSLEKYFVTTWSIASTRIEKKLLHSDSINEVWLESNDAAVIAPLVNSWVDRTYSLPEISIKQNVKADTAIQRWEIVVSQGKQLLGSFSSDQYQREVKDIFTQTIPIAPQVSAFDPLTATLTIHYRTGSSTLLHDTLSLKQLTEDNHRTITEESVILPNQSAESTLGVQLDSLLLTRFLSAKDPKVKFVIEGKESWMDNSSMFGRVMRMYPIQVSSIVKKPTMNTTSCNAILKITGYSSESK